MEILDTVRLRIQYAVKYRETLEDPMRKDMEALYIGDNMSEFRENVCEYAYEHIPDSLKELANRKKDKLTLNEQMIIGGAESIIRRQYKCSDYTIQKNYPSEGIQTCYDFIELDGMINNPMYLNPHLVYTETMPQFDWELLDGDTTVCGYACQQARTSFRGRTWTVWYAPELPYQDGPWKLCGLPGLIMKACDAEGDFLFEAIEIKRCENAYIRYHTMYSTFVRGTFKRAQELNQLRYENPEALHSMMWGDKIATFEQYGPKHKFPPKRTAREIEKFE